MVPPSHWCIFHGPKKVNPRCMPNHFPLESTMVRDFLVGPVVHPSLPVESLASKICKNPRRNLSFGITPPIKMVILEMVYDGLYHMTQIPPNISWSGS